MIVHGGSRVGRGAGGKRRDEIVRNRGEIRGDGVMVGGRKQGGESA